jgi:AhpD family alkylhydroperoxidase
MVVNLMGEYEDVLKDIEKTLGIVPGYMKALPKDVLIHDWALYKKYSIEESKIPAKYKEMIGLAVAANIKCPYCQYDHLNGAKFEGATDEELAEVYYLASFTSRWSAMIHAQNYDLETFIKESKKIFEHFEKTAKK